MGREQSLLERIASGLDGGRRGSTTQEDLHVLVESVRGNLERLLNSRHGMSETVPDYGLPALTDIVVSGDRHVQLLREAMQQAVEKYEPRLRRVRVSVVEQEGETKRMGFRIDGVLVSDSGEHRVWYGVALSGGGEFEVSG